MARPTWLWTSTRRQKGIPVKKRSLLSVLVAMVAALTLSATALAASFFNGSFEGTPGPGNFTQLDAGSTAIQGWVVGGNRIDWIGTYYTAQDEADSLDLNASPGLTGSGGSISQTFDTIAGKTYVVSFWFAGNPTVDPTCLALKTMTVNATGGGTSTFQFDTTGTTTTAMGWAARGYAFQATGASTTLTFASTTLGNCGPALDNVVVTQTTPMGTQCKNGGWVGMFDLNGTPFKNQGDCVSYFATGATNLGDGTP
jgi:choice-of-anchor C domain-containing protein